jgi:spermidine/putrescine transport system permease protein
MAVEIERSPARAPGELREARVARRTWLLAVPAVLALLVLFVAPLVIFTVYAFFDGAYYEVTSTLTLDNFKEALQSESARDLALNAVVMGLATAGLCVLIGLPLAFLIRFRAGRLEYPLLFLVVLAMFASYLVRIYAWRTILGDDGVLNSGLRSLGLPTVGTLLYSKAAVVIALVHIFLPYVTLVAYASLRNLPGDLLDLASDLGAGAASRWRRVVLPLVAPAAAAGFLYTFVLAASDYVTPQFLGGRDGNMIGLLIQQQFTQIGDYPLGAAMSLLMLVLFLAFYGAIAFVLRALKLSDVAVKY